MKKAFALLLVITSVVLIIGLLIKVEEKSSDIKGEIKEEIVEETFSFSEESINEETDEYVLNVHYPVTNDDNINIEIDEFITESIDTFKSDIEGFDEVSVERKYWLNVWFEIKDSDRYKTVVFSTSVDFLGPHPNNFYDTLTFNDSSELVSFEDLLQEEFGDQSVINDISAIATYKLTDEFESEVAEMLWIDDGTSPENSNFEDFYVLDEEMVFLFETYSIGPYAIGSREVEVRFDEINTLEDI